MIELIKCVGGDGVDKERFFCLVEHVLTWLARYAWEWVSTESFKWGFFNVFGEGFLSDHLVEAVVEFGVVEVLELEVEGVSVFLGLGLDLAVVGVFVFVGGVVVAVGVGVVAFVLLAGGAEQA